MSATIWIACAALGAFGAVARAETAAAMTSRLGAGFPWGTVTVNLTGAFALGVIHGAGLGGRPLLLAGAAFLGAMTTFSTWMLETLRLARVRPVAAAMNIGGQLIAGLALAALGNALGACL
jgi:CrcB protein